MYLVNFISQKENRVSKRTLLSTSMAFILATILSSVLILRATARRRHRKRPTSRPLLGHDMGDEDQKGVSTSSTSWKTSPKNRQLGLQVPFDNHWKHSRRIAGVMLISGNPDDIPATLDSSEEYSDVSGIVV